MGSYTYESLKATVPYTQAAEFQLAQEAVYARKPDPAPFQAFIKKYLQSPLVKTAYSYLTNYYGRSASAEEAAKFFDDYTAKFPDDKDALNAYVERIIRDKGPVDKGLAMAEKLKEMAGYPQNANYQENLAQLSMLKDDPAKAAEEYGSDFAESYGATVVSSLNTYVNFWIDHGQNLESAEDMADILAAIIRTGKDAPSYMFAQVATLFAKLKKMDKALGLYGPEYAKRFWDDPSALSSYASFWSRQGTNLESGLAAVRRSVGLSSGYSNNFVLGQILFKMKDYGEALKAAEKAVELVKPMAVKYEGFATQQYENLVKQIKEAMAKGPGAEIKK
jgi:tetratricopeptide (TPR) repeat protein